MLKTTELFDFMLNNWNTNYIITNACISSQLYLMKKRAYCKMIFISGSVSTRFKNYKELKIENESNSVEIFMNKEENFLSITDTNDMMNHSKFFIDNSERNAPKQKEHILIQLSKNEELKNQMEGQFRPNIDQYFMKIAYNARNRSNCMKRAVGSVIVLNNRVLSIGYNGTPVNITNCYEKGCERCNQNYPQGKGLDKCFCLHGEESAILEIGAKNAKGSTLYSTLFPCLWCAKMIIQCQIKRIVFVQYFNSEGSSKILKQSGIEMMKLEYEDRVN